MERTRNGAVGIVLMLCLAVAVLTLSGCEVFREEQTVGEYIDDTVLTSRVKTELIRAEDVSGTDIQVETFNGIVQLSGFVRSEQEKRRAEEIARRVPGVRDVDNAMRVK